MSMDNFFPDPAAANRPHEFQYDGRYGCIVCGEKQHCGSCSRGSGPQGHLVRDEDGTYLHCEEPERYQRQIEKFVKKSNRKNILGRYER